MSNYIEEIDNAGLVIENNAYELERLSRAFYLTGNAHLAEILGSMAKELHKARKDIRRAVSKNVTERYNDAQQGTANMINACLAMGEIKGVKAGE